MEVKETAQAVSYFYAKGSELVSIPKIKVVQEGTITHVFMDGNEIHGIRKLSFEQTAYNLPILNLDIIGTDMEIDSLVVPELPDVFKPFYEKQLKITEEEQERIERALKEGGFKDETEL